MFERQPMFPELSQLAAHHPVLVSSSALGFVLALRKLCITTKLALIGALRGAAEVWSVVCEVLVKCSKDWHHCKSRLVKQR